MPAEAAFRLEDRFEAGAEAVDQNRARRAQAAALSAQLEALDAPERLARALNGALPGPIAMVSSFGADSAVLLSMLAKVSPETPVLFLETQMLFAETLDYQAALADRLGLTDVRLITPDVAALRAEDPTDDLHRRDPDACCDLRKTRPLERALAPFASAISGRKRHQAASRRHMPVVEIDGAGRYKLNPLADWTAADLKAYREAEDLPPHPLVAEGYPSIGCAPCTSRAAEGEDPRAGRWRGSDKTECGIHVIDGRLIRLAGG